MYEIIFRNPVKRFLKKLDKNIQKEILNKIETLRKNPRVGEPLRGYLKGLWRLRYNQYRIIYKIKDIELIIFVLNIGHRGEIYHMKIGKNGR